MYTYNPVFTVVCLSKDEYRWGSWAESGRRAVVIVVVVRWGKGVLSCVGECCGCGAERYLPISQKQPLKKGRLSV